ncbi:NRDE family protein [Pelagicoccus mobilis]|uniref:NRDE family protein n=1 Tax=Pelagicoccus mobilis TaxID=415221 RepID=A0A934S032_9BACT|nr:NRDE family protein [Pelagicoccus mobilis]MBK1876999.1 NRDE family protein [Pelagicoccus mobilis]
MCTASWRADGGRFSLCFNRDERRSRKEALPPKLLERSGPRTLAAIDPEGGGTWLAVNECGLCVYLLNNYAAQARVKPLGEAVSRGKLPLELSLCLSRESANATLLKELDLSCFNPFLIALADRSEVSVFAWDGVALLPVELARPLLTTSSYKTEEIESYRTKEYERRLAERSGLTASERFAYHTELAHADPAFNPLMLRADSRTHSVSVVEVDEKGIRYRYARVDQDRRALGEESVLEIARARS